MGCLRQPPRDDRKVPGWEEFRIASPRSLLDPLDAGDGTPQRVRALLGRVGSGEPFDEPQPPLAPDQKAKAAQVQFHCVWYEDRFHYGGDRDSYAVAVCLTREEAQEEARRRGAPPEPGADGCEVVGPSSLADERRPGVVREVLKSRAAGRRPRAWYDHLQLTTRARWGILPAYWQYAGRNASWVRPE